MALPQGMFYEALGKKIRQARDERNISQAEMARTIGLSRTSITNIEKGRQPIQVHVLVKIAETLGVNLATFLVVERSRSGKDKKSNLKKYDRAVREWATDIIGAESTLNGPDKK